MVKLETKIGELENAMEHGMERLESVLGFELKKRVGQAEATI